MDVYCRGERSGCRVARWSWRDASKLYAKKSNINAWVTLQSNMSLFICGLIHHWTLRFFSLNSLLAFCPSCILARFWLFCDWWVQVTHHFVLIQFFFHKRLISVPEPLLLCALCLLRFHVLYTIICVIYYFTVCINFKCSHHHFNKR